ncbi:hypothetical protein AB664_31615 [Brucella anthropi]|uniref:Uncharacterized protein n=1 Tax=Brucella anthropi TaxID=529 RepID=A0A656Z6E7_BRUAN|nr:hypothetical protein AB664_31615 [Brucella anthropi]
MRRAAAARAARRRAVEQHNHAVAAPAGIQKMQRNQRRLTRAGRSNQNRACMGGKCDVKLRQNAGDGKIGQTRQMKFRIIKALLWCLSHKER